MGNEILDMILGPAVYDSNESDQQGSTEQVSDQYNNG